MREVAGAAAEILARPPDGSARSLTVCRFPRPALVLGSSQPGEHVEVDGARAKGVEIARRRSGGGAVLLQSDRVVWTEVFVPTGDALHHLDVGRAFWWLGQVWAEALESLGVPQVHVHRQGLVSTAWSSRACFAGLGPGEVTVKGRKAVGLSQRRTRAGSLFQCAVLIDFDPDGIAGLMRLDKPEKAALSRHLSDFAAGVGPWADHQSVLERFVAVLLEPPTKQKGCR